MSGEELRAALDGVEAALTEVFGGSDDVVWDNWRLVRAALAAPSTPEPEYDADGDPIRPDPHSNDWYDGYAAGQRDAAPFTPEPSGHCRGCEADADLARRAHGPAPSTPEPSGGHVVPRDLRETFGLDPLPEALAEDEMARSLFKARIAADEAAEIGGDDD